MEVFLGLDKGEDTNGLDIRWRRINTEEKAKVIPAAGGMELIQFLAAFASGWFEEKDE